MATSYQAWYQFQCYPAWDIVLNTDAGADDLTGVDITKFTMTFRDTLGTGTFSLKVAYPAEILYKPSPADVALPFNGQLFIKALFPPSGTSADLVCYDPIPFVVLAS
jgi:hypothetical protein